METIDNHNEEGLHVLCISFATWTSHFHCHELLWWLKTLIPLGRILSIMNYGLWTTSTKYLQWYVKLIELYPSFKILATSASIIVALP